jgi:UDP-2-acetamido-2,6-beta-L-arabino-hexul-4-ose reductase
MKRVGITGQDGFVGWHLANTIWLIQNKFELIPFGRNCFSDPALMDSFVQRCDVIVHLAAVNRNPDPEILYETNVGLANALAESLLRCGSDAHIVFSSSTQEERDNHYGRSKQKARLILQANAKARNACFSGLIIPNVFGPFGKPFYNSVIATFCHQLTHGQEPRIDVDATLKLIHVSELVKQILDVIDINDNNPALFIPHTKEIAVSEILTLLLQYRDEYHEKGMIPSLKDIFEVQLFNTFRCAEDIRLKFPARYTQHTDNRGAFTELIRLNIGGQVSFSTTHPGITRGNHFHTRKIERFSVIKGKAQIQLRKIGTSEVFDFDLSGDAPAYVDMPIWYTHNITNTGDDELLTVFWINEWFDPADPDTFFETV